MRRDLERLQDILEAIDRIQKHTARRRQAFDSYFGLDLDEVWSAADRDLPGLKTQIQAIVSSEQASAD